MIKKAKRFILLLLCFGLSVGYAQQALITAGNSASGTGGSISYSVGQVVYTTNNGKLGSVSQGVQQTYSISFVGVKQEAKIAGKEKSFYDYPNATPFFVFPNPVSDNLIVQIPEYKNERCSYKLFDMHGRLLISNTVTSSRTEINTSGLPASVYFLHIMKENKQIHSFKIIKN